VVNADPPFEGGVHVSVTTPGEATSVGAEAIADGTDADTNSTDVVDGLDVPMPFTAETLNE
jgi:hypothetical protein